MFLMQLSCCWPMENSILKPLADPSKLHKLGSFPSMEPHLSDTAARNISSS
jgi:hypothetical protein